MRREFLKSKKKLLTGVLVLFLTVAYLIATSATTQAYKSSVTEINYAAPAASFGDNYADVGMMSEGNYTASKYSAIGKNVSSDANVTFHNTNPPGKGKDGTSTTPNKHYGKITINPASVSNAVQMKELAYGTQLNKNWTLGSVTSKVTFDGSEYTLGEVPVLKSNGGDASYTIVPSSTGAYYIYAYSTAAPTVKYSLVSDYTAANALADGTYTGTLSFQQISGNWWCASVAVDNLSWNVYRVSNTMSSDTDVNAAKHQISVDGGTSATFTSMTFGPANDDNYYFNKWAVNTDKLDTLLVLNWSDANIAIAPVGKADNVTASIAADAQNVVRGDVSIYNIFGEEIPCDGTATNAVHAPLYVISKPKAEFADNYLFAMDGILVSQHPGSVEIRKFDHTKASSLLGSWDKMEILPSVTVNDGVAVLDFYKKTIGTGTSYRNVVDTFEFSVDFTDCEVSEVQYSIVGENATTAPVKVTGNSVVKVPVRWQTTQVVFTVQPLEGSMKTITYTVNKVENPNIDPSTYVARNGDRYYCYLEDALVNAKPNETIVVIAEKCGFLPMTEADPGWAVNNVGYTIKNGVTLLLPYAENMTTVTTKTESKDGDSASTLEYANTALSHSDGLEKDALNPYNEDNLYLTVTVPAGVDLVVEGGGKFVIGGKLASGLTGPGVITGATAGGHSNLILEGNENTRSTITVKKDGILSVTGFILGEGTVNVENDGKVYQPFVLADHLGGSYVASAYYSEQAVFPFTRYAMLNIQSNIHMESGGLMKGYAVIYTTKKVIIETYYEIPARQNVSVCNLVGDESTADNALIALKSGATLDISYDADVYVDDDAAYLYSRIGRTTLHFNGNQGSGAKLSGIEISVNVPSVGEMGANSKNLNLPIPYNYNIILDGTQTVYDINYNTVLMPGATMTVKEGATLKVSTVDSKHPAVLAVLDGLRDHHTTTGADKFNPTTWYSAHYPKTECLQAAPFNGNGSANLVVNGKLEVASGASLGGLVQTDGGSGAQITMNGTNNTTVYHGVLKVTSSLANDCSGQSVHVLPAQIVDNETGALTQMVTGGKYYGATGTTAQPDFTYTLRWGDNSEVITLPLGATLKGTWYSYTGTIKTVDDSGTEISSRPAKIAKGADLSGYYSDAACQTPATGVTADGFVLYFPASKANAYVDWAEEGKNDTYYSSIYTALYNALNTGTNNTAVLLKDIEKDQNGKYVAEGFAIPKGKTVTLNLNGHKMYLAGAVANAGNFTLDFALEDGDSSTALLESPNTVITNNGTMTVNAGEGTVNMTGEAYATILNNPDGTLTIEGTGKITAGFTPANPETVKTAFKNGGQDEAHAAVVRNYGTLTTKGVTLEQTASNILCAVVVNHRGTIELMENTVINAKNPSGGGFGLINLGGTITKIKGGSITAFLGIQNQNIRTGVNTDELGYVVTDIARIECIEDTKVATTTDGQYALRNFAQIGTIGGTASFTSYKDLTVYNADTWFFDTNANKKYDHGDGVVEQWYDYYPKYVLLEDGVITKGYDSYPDEVPVNGEIKQYLDCCPDIANGGVERKPKPTIEHITGSVEISTLSPDDGATKPNYALRNYGYIDLIDGDVEINAAGSYALHNGNGGVIKEIGGSVKAEAESYVLNNAGQANSYYIQTTVENSDGKEINIVYTYGPASTISKIHGAKTTTGDGISLSTRTSSYGIINSGYIGEITGKIDISLAYKEVDASGATVVAGGNYAIYNNPDAANVSQDYNRRFDIDGNEIYRYQRYYKNMETGSYIGLIGGEGSEISLSAQQYCIGNNGYIGKIDSGISYTNNKQDAAPIINSDSRQTGYINEYTIEDPITVEGKYKGHYPIRLEKTYFHDAKNYPATIDVITNQNMDRFYMTETTASDGTVTQTRTDLGYGINNAGRINKIENCTIAAKNYAITNNGNGHYDGERYSVTYYTNSVRAITTTSGLRNVAELVYEYTRAKSYIGSIDNCKITATANYAVNNSGLLNSITNCTIDGTGYALVNKGDCMITYKLRDGYIVTGTDGRWQLANANGAGYLDRDCTYASPEINLIGGGNVVKASGTYALANTGIIHTIDGGSNPSTFVSATSYGIYNYHGVMAQRTTVYNGTKTATHTQDSYHVAGIDSIKNTNVIGKNYAIYSVGNATYDAIKTGDRSVYTGELGDGLIAIATNGSSYFAVRADNLSTIDLISGGYYCNAKKDQPGSAVHNYADKTYPAGMTLSSYSIPVVCSYDGTNEDVTYNCYFVTYNADHIIFDKFSLSTADEVVLNLKFFVPEDTTAVTVRVTEEANAVEGAKTVTYVLADMVPDEKGRYEFNQPIAAGEMSGNITVEFLDAAGNNVDIFDGEGNKLTVTDANGVETSKVVKKVTDYADRVYAQDVNVYRDLIDLVSSALDFGGNSQKYFQTHPDRLAYDAINRELYTKNIADVNAEMFNKGFSVTGADIGLTYSQMMVNVNSSVYMRTYFDAVDPTAQYNVKVTSSAGQNACDYVRAGYVGDQFCVEIRGIPVAYWDAEFVIEITRGADSDNALKVTCSVLDWARFCLEKQGQEGSEVTDVLANVAKAMYYYNEAANKYWAK